jgi:spore coat polysaccharide biosynthesis protein SpsF
VTTEPILPRRLVLGAAQLGQQYGNGADREPPDAAAAVAILRTAIAGGVDELDTARAYGASEAVLGDALSALGTGAKTLGIVTKVRPLDEFAVDDDPAAVRRAVRDSLDASLTHLRRERVDAVLLHRARDLTVAGGAAVAALDALTTHGRMARWGVSVGSPADLLSACATPGVGYVQLPFNLLDRRWLDDGVQRALRDRPDIRIVARSVLLQGLLSSRDPHRWPAIPGLGVTRTLTTLAELATELGRSSVLDLAIGYALGQSWIDAVVLGVRRADQLPDLLEATSAPPLSPAEIDLVHRQIHGGPLDLVDPSRWSQYPKTS